MSAQYSYCKVIRVWLEKLNTTITESIQNIDQPTSYENNNLSATNECISNGTLDSFNQNEEEIINQRKDRQNFAKKIYVKI